MTGQDFPFVQEYKYVEFAAAGTVILWQPRLNNSGSTNRVTLTGLSYSTNIPSSVAIYVGTNSTGPQKIAMFQAGSSATVSPNVGFIRNTMVGGILYANISAGSTGGSYLLATGFEEE